jgi:glycosyltransferase involved in cell wall biosynthesis
VLVPNEKEELGEPEWAPVLDKLGIITSAFESLPQQLQGWGLSMCNFEFLMSPKWAEARRRGLKMAWSNEMMWTHPSELGALFAGLIDQVLYVSPVQRACLEPEFEKAWTGSLQPRPHQDHDALSGEIQHDSSLRALRWSITSNYIDPALFPAKEIRVRNREEPLVVGRLSRADPGKFPEDFPKFYEGLGLRNVRFRVMAWSEELSRRWAAHPFDDRWQLLPALQEDASSFLRSLDLFVYSLGPDLRESWGRCVVEAMLSGVVPLLPDSADHHLRNLVRHGESGFLCRSAEEYGHYARMLDQDRALLCQCAHQARADALSRHCSAADHLAYWENAFPEL